MRFGPTPVAEAVGGVLAHTLRHGAMTLKKGAVITPRHAAELAEAGVESVVVALMDEGEIGENEGAARLAAAIAGSDVEMEPPFTGRSNLFARTAGLLMVDAGAIDAANAIDEAITIATLPAMRAVIAGEMVGTVKIIPFAVDKALVERAGAMAQGAVRVVPFRSRRITVISTLLPALKPSIVDKTFAVLMDRLATLALPPEARHLRVPHESEALAEALAEAIGHGSEIVIVFGASAITDRRDVVPAAVEAAGGRIEHLGMPVDPGNLLLLGEIAGALVIGAPGCARSPKENGFDWVLQRLLADVPVSKADIQRMGVGGLLMEIVSRPQPRSALATAGHPPVAAVVLAAGRSTRMGSNKLLELLEGQPVVRHVALAALASQARPVLVVAGHQAQEVEAALAGLDVRLVHNPRFAEGMATSLQAGCAAVPVEAAGCVVLLGDMPLVTAGVVDRLIESFAAQPDAVAVVPVADGRRANPALLTRRIFGQLAGLSGDEGARRLLEAAADGVVDVMIPDHGVLLDVDTPAALDEARRLAAG